MSDDRPLSEEVQAYIDTLDSEGLHELPPPEREEATRNRRMIEFIVKTIVKSRESITGDKLKGLEILAKDTPDTVSYFINDYFTREAIDAVPGYVRRTLELSRIEAEQQPSKITNGYLREAVRTYILGLPQACVALCRAAMEQALKEQMGYQSTRTYIEMNELLNEAETAGVLDSTLRLMARHIAKEANDVLHEKPADMTVAYKVLVELRGLLTHVYAD